MPRKKRVEGSRAPNGASSIYLGQDGKWHGRVSMGVKDNGKQDRRHVERMSETEVIAGVRELERQRDAGTVPKAGSRDWSVETWLTHWVKNIAAPSVRENTLAGYRTAVYKHLIPGLGAHRLAKLEPEHLEKLYAKMSEAGAKPGTAHQVHRTAKTAFRVAVDRERMLKNPAKLAKAPQLDEDEVVPFTAVEGRRIMAAAEKKRNGARFVVALALGLRKGEALGSSGRVSTWTPACSTRRAKSSGTNGSTDAAIRTLAARGCIRQSLARGLVNGTSSLVRRRAQQTASDMRHHARSGTAAAFGRST